MRTSERLYNIEKKKLEKQKQEEEYSLNKEKYEVEKIQKINKDAISKKEQITETIKNENVGKYFDRNNLGK